MAHGALGADGNFYPDGGPWTPFYRQWSGACATACGLGTYWSCVGHIGWPVPKSATVMLRYTGVEYVTSAPVAGLDVSVCSPLDLACATRLAGARTDDNGIAVMTVQNPPDFFGLGLDGFLQETSPDAGYVPVLLYWGYPLSEANNPSPTAGQEYSITPSEYQLLAGALGVTLDPKRGLIFENVSDCMFNLSPGVRVTLDVQDPAIREFYGQSNPMATETDSTGLVIIANVPPGNVNLTATPLALKDKPSSKVTVQVRAGWITGGILWPTP
jgi:hypothetical protein